MENHENIIFEQKLNTTAEIKIYQKLKKKIIEEEIKPLRKKVILLEREVEYLKANLRKLGNPSMKIISKLKEDFKK